MKIPWTSTEDKLRVYSVPNVEDCTFLFDCKLYFVERAVHLDPYLKSKYDTLDKLSYFFEGTHLGKLKCQRSI